LGKIAKYVRTVGGLYDMIPSSVPAMFIVLMIQMKRLWVISAFQPTHPKEFL